MSGPTLSSFLAAFFPDPADPVHLRAFGPKGCDVSLLEYTPKKIKTTIAELPSRKDDLLKLNRTRGLYFVVNAGGDCDSAISRYTAVYCEDDSRPIAEQHARLEAAAVSNHLSDGRRRFDSYGRRETSSWRQDRFRYHC